MKTYIYLLLSLTFVYNISLKSSKKGSLRGNFFDEPIQNMLEIKYSINNNIIELEPDYIITKIGWTKREDYKFNYLLGIFEGSNDPSFLDAVPIAMIKEQGNLNAINYIDVNIPRVYKYIRYIPPNQNKTDISPIKFYGQLQSEIDINLREDFQITNLPLISIHTEDSIKPTQKSQELNCKIVITNEGKIQTKEDATIKVRGKSTSMQEKKPYKIKFNTKQEILGLKGSYKKWTLIANHYDRSLMRNALAFKVGQLVGYEYTPRCLPVDLVLNAEYRGNYYLCDQIEIGKDRINIDKMEKTDITEPNITGGYYCEIDGGGDFYGYTNLVTPKGIKWKINEPDEDDITEEQKNYIIGKMNQFESEAYNGIFNSMDYETYSKFFLVEEFCGDPDELWSSFYFTKRRNDDKFYFGPIWDFDLAFDNDMRLIPTNDKPDFVFNYAGGAQAGTMLNFTKILIGEKSIINYIRETWENLKKTTLNEDALINFIDQQQELIKESAELNFIKWDNYVKEKNSRKRGRSKINSKSFTADIDTLKDYIKKRFVSLTNIIDKAVPKAK